MTADKDTPFITEKYRWLKANGGYKWHLVPRTTGAKRSLCGFMPRDHPNSSMSRARWAYASDGPIHRGACAKCLEQATP